MKFQPLSPKSFALPILGALLLGCIAFFSPIKLPLGFESKPQNSDLPQPFQKEIDFYQTKLQAQPDSALTLASLASTYVKNGKATGDVSWYLLAEQTALRSLASLPFNNSGAQLTLAKVAQARHDFKQAKSIAQSMLKANPKADEARSILVTCNLATGDLKAADELVQPLVDGMPNLENMTLLGLVEEAQGKPAAAKTLELAMTVEEVGEERASAFTRVMLGRHFYRTGQLDRAAQLYQSALKFTPNYPLALLHLAVLETRRGNYGEADRHYDRVMSTKATIYDHTVLRGKARLKQLQKQPSDALLNQAETLLRSDQGGFGHRRELAQLLLDRNQAQDKSEALTLMQAEVKNRRDAQTLAVFARSLVMSDRFAEAKTAMDSALKLGQKNAGMLLQAAEIEQKLGNTLQAKVYRRQAAQIDLSFDETAQIVLGLDTL